MSISNSVILSAIARPDSSFAEPSGEAAVPPCDSDMTVVETTSTIESASNIEPKSSPISDSIPLDGITDVLVQTAKLVADAAPIPWIGPAVELVAAIVKMCRNVSKNRNAATTLAKHCEGLLTAVQNSYSNQDQAALEKMRLEMESLLENIKSQMENWADLHLFKAFVEQETISQKINSYHAEIDFFCKRYTIIVHTELVTWQTEHSKQSKADHEELITFLTDLANTNELENRCRREDIRALREDLNAFSKLVQTLLLGLTRRREPEQIEQTEQSEALEKILSVLYRSSGTLPPDMELTEGLIQKERDPRFGDIMFDIYRGTCFNDINCQCAFRVVKRMNMGPRTRTRFERQLGHWKSIQEMVVQARSRNEKLYILPLIGAIYRDYGQYPFFCLISPWMDKGNALDYVKVYENVDRLSMIRKIAQGLKVLHTHKPPLAHGYIQASNILIDDTGDPLLSEFGLMRIVEDDTAEPMDPTSLPPALVSVRWRPLELLFPPGDDIGNVLTTKSDIFMYAMTVLELMTGEHPFPDIKTETQLVIFRSSGGKPKKPQGDAWESLRRRGLDDHLWELLEKCWADEPKDRPTIIEVLEYLPAGNKSSIP